VCLARVYESFSHAKRRNIFIEHFILLSADEKTGSCNFVVTIFSSRGTSTSRVASVAHFFDEIFDLSENIMKVFCFRNKKSREK
jgi:hypothetical protein